MGRVDAEAAVEDAATADGEVGDVAMEAGAVADGEAAGVMMEDVAVVVTKEDVAAGVMKEDVAVAGEDVAGAEVVDAGTGPGPTSGERMCFRRNCGVTAFLPFRR